MQTQSVSRTLLLLTFLVLGDAVKTEHLLESRSQDLLRLKTGGGVAPSQGRLWNGEELGSALVRNIDTFGVKSRTLLEDAEGDSAAGGAVPDDNSGHPRYVQSCFNSGVKAILYALPNYSIRGTYVALTSSIAELQPMCFEPKSVLLAPGVDLTLMLANNETVKLETSSDRLSLSGRPLSAKLVKDGRDVEDETPDVPHEEARERFEARMEDAFKGVRHVQKLRFDASGKYILKQMGRAKYKKGPYILPRRAEGKQWVEAWPSPEACFEMTHVYSAQRGCHHDPAWLDLAKEFVPRYGGVTHTAKYDSDIVAIENGMGGLKDMSVLDVDVGSRIKGPCGFDVKHMDIDSNKKLSVSREKVKSMKDKWTVRVQMGLLRSMLIGNKARKASSGAQLLLEDVKRIAELLSRQRTALLYDSSILLLLGKDDDGNDIGRVKLIDFGKEIHVYADRFRKIVPNERMARGQKCAFGCGAKELADHVLNLSKGGAVPNRCLNPCSSKTWKNKSCQPIMTPKKLDGMRAD